MSTPTEKNELFRKVYIKSVDDLPKEDGSYWVKTSLGIFYWIFEKGEDETRFLKRIDWYLQPIEPEQLAKTEKEMIEQGEKKERTYPVIAIDDIDVETVKRWFQLYMGFGDDSHMKSDIRAMARASHLNKHLVFEGDHPEQSDRKTAEEWLKERYSEQLIHENLDFLSEMLNEYTSYASQGMPEISETEMETYFLNHYNCFANNEDEEPAMTRSEAIDMCKWAMNKLKSK